MTRTARIGRITGETQVLVELNLDGTGVGRAETGVPFFDHMLAQLGRHALVDLTVQAHGETLVRVAVDLSGRPYVVHIEPDGMPPLIGTYDTTLTRHFFETLGHAAGICIHVDVLRGRNPHHIVEAQFKAFARAMQAAAAPDPRSGGTVPSTKGVL